jgi:hypothetical protein
VGFVVDKLALRQNIPVDLLPVIITPVLHIHLQHHHPYHQAVQ